ncbi:hypothetical protein NX059_003219 [Plenodomus lindquistii]|nr:hypothetical protein NX059_003219 [Plenodomus lindquistii]
MASFFEQLWESIFTPGPTPTLLVATNASFAALQLLFFAMLIATYSIHFIILSFLCAGLWWSINWFAVEIRAAQAKEEEAKRIREARRGGREKGDGADADGEGGDTGDDTEVDNDAELKQTLKPKPKSRESEQSTVFVDRPAGGDREETPQASQAEPGSGPVAAGTQGTTTSLAPLVDDALKKRKGLGDSTGDLLGTDSEWEKLSEGSGDR